jgi:hypothetical protein
MRRNLRIGFLNTRYNAPPATNPAITPTTFSDPLGNMFVNPRFMFLCGDLRDSSIGPAGGSVLKVASGAPIIESLTCLPPPFIARSADAPTGLLTAKLFGLRSPECHISFPMTAKFHPLPVAIKEQFFFHLRPWDGWFVVTVIGEHTVR